MQKIIFIFLFVIFICDVLYVCASENFRLCVDEKCSVPMSRGKTKITYNAPDLHLLSFKINTELKVFSKVQGYKRDLWGVEINKKKGYVPSMYISETGVTKIPEIKVPYSFPGDLFPPLPEIEEKFGNAIKTDIPLGASGDTPSPANVIPPHAVIDGTTIYMDSDDDIMSSKEKLVESASTDNSFNSNREYDDEGEWDLDYKEEKDIITVTTESPKEETSVKENLENNLNNVENGLSDTNTENSDSVSSTEKIVEFTSTDNSFNFNGEHDEDEDEWDLEYNKENDIKTETTEPTKEKSLVKEHSDLKLVNISNNTENDLLDKNLSNLTNNNELNEENTKKITPELTIENTVNKSDLGSQGELMNSTQNTNDSNVEIKTENSEAKDPILKQSSGMKPDGIITDNNLMNSKIISKENSEIKSEEVTDTIQDQSKLYIRDTGDEDKLDKSVNIPDSKVNVPKIIESFQHSSSVEVNPKSDTKDTINDHTTLVSDTIEVTTDNTTAYSHNTEDIPEIKSDKSSVETVVLSPERSEENEIINSVENLGMSLDKHDLSSEELDNSPDRFTSNQLPNPVNNLDLLNNPISLNDIESNTEKQLEKLREETVSYLDTVVKNDETSNLENIFNSNNDKISNSENVYNSNGDDHAFTEDFINNVQTESETSEEIINVNSEQIDFLTTVYEFFGIYRSKELALMPDTDSNFNNVESQSALDNENTYKKNENFMCKNRNEHSIYSLQQFEILESTYGIIIYLTITAITVLIFTLGYYYIEKLRQDGTLVKRINELEKALLNSNKEKNILRNELELSQGAEAPISLLEKLRDELEESNRLRIELEEQNVNLERELETATEAGLELNKMLGEYLSSQQSGNLVEESLEYLQKQLNDQQLTIAEMTVTANEKAKEFETNLTELSTLKEKNSELTNELNSLVVSLTKLQEDSHSREVQLNEQITILKTQFEKEINDKNQEIHEKNNELNQIRELSKQLQHNLNVMENEVMLLKENLQGDEKNVDNIIDNTHIRAELKEVNAENDLLTKQLQDESEQKKSLENKLMETISEKDNLHTQLQSLEKEKIEIQTRLEVLSAYFKEKETQLQKELTKHEELWLQNQGQANSTVERIKLLQEEIQNYKTQNEMLKNEIVDQEVSLKSQISVMEKKNHENWLLLRQTERRLEESKQECSQLRNRLTIVEKNLNSDDKSQFRVVSPPLNGDLSTSPIHMIEPPVSSPVLFPHRDNMPATPSINFMSLPPPPPPPGALPFMPPPPPGVPFMPPPPTLFPGDRRPPPLGRMSSPPPPPPNTFSPPRTFSPYDQDRDSPPIRDRLYNLYDNDNNYRHRSPPPFTSLPPPRTDQAKDWENRQSFRPIEQQRPTNRSKTNLNSNEFV